MHYKIKAEWYSISGVDFDFFERMVYSAAVEFVIFITHISARYDDVIIIFYLFAVSLLYKDFV